MDNITLETRGVCVTQCIAKTLDGASVDALALLHAIEAIKSDPTPGFTISNQGVLKFLEQHNLIDKIENGYAVNEKNFDVMDRLSNDLDDYINEQFQELESLFDEPKCKSSEK